MIVAGLTLLAIGCGDLLRRAAAPRRRALGLAVGAVAILVLGAASDAPLPAMLAVAVAAEWIWLLPAGRGARAGVWPVAGVLVLCAVAIAFVGVRDDPGFVGAWWRLPSPGGDIPFDLAVLVAGSVAFLAESANIAVRAALGNDVTAEATQPRDRDGRGGDDPVPFDEPPTLKGGRLIGPLERIVVFALTLAGAYTLLAAVLAAKGIVRFPEISRDDDGDRAEYFLVGSLVSWVVALSLALLAWWGWAGVQG